MAKPQIVTGSFDDISEAQQAVQLLLGNGFSADRVDFSTTTGVRAKEADLTGEEHSTGRFLTTLFGDADGDEPSAPGGGDDNADLRGDTARVTVQVWSALEVDRAIDSLKAARAVTVSKPEEE